MTALAEAAWWAGLRGDDLRLNVEGDPPYDAQRVAWLIHDRISGGTSTSRVLDVGCGIGRFTDVYRPFCAEVVGFDPTPQILAEARLRLPGVRFFDRLPPGPFDGAYSVTVFQHLTHLTCARLVRDVMARLRPGGRFCFQYVEGTEDAFLSHQADEATVRGWCAGLDVTVDRDPEFGEWRWVTVR